MKISSEKKRETLMKNFEIIKDNYEDNGNSLSSVVSKMFKIDLDMGIDMWTYLLTKHEAKVKDDDSYCITGSIIYHLKETVGKERMCEIVLGNPVLKKCIFSYTGDSIEYAVGDIIQRKIETDELQVADELLNMVYKNKYRNSSWYEVMDDILDGADEMEISEEAYDLLESWCDRVKSKEERAKLSIKMLEFIHDDEDDEDEDYSF
ncbi:MAG: hypothetical protein SO386_01210 [Eubacteriales bacterium]|nr:hypothetical protein [Eubacteriales bacterium]